MRSRTWFIGALLFGSGFSALVYQVGWLREFRLIFGASTAASAAVLAIFIGGLGVGGLILGPRADRHPRPLLFYAQLETIVGLSAAASPFLLSLAQSVYLASGGSSRLGMAVATLLRLGLSALVLAVPALTMGATLPAAARAATHLADVRRTAVAALYALNTLGAVAGSFAATFFLLERLGTRRTIWLAAAVNLIVAAIAARNARELDAETGAEERPDAPARERAAPVAFLLTASATVGFAFFLMEIVWYRMLAPLLGGSVFTFGLILALALLGVGVGGLVYALVGSDRPATLDGFATSCLLESVCVAATLALGDRLAVLAIQLQPPSSAGFLINVSAWAIVAGIVVLPPALVAGYQFPLLIALFGRGRNAVGREIGLAYAANTAGAIAGSLAGGFGFLPWLGAPGAWRLVAAVLLVMGIAAAALTKPLRRVRALAARTAMAAATIALLFATGPTAAWRHTGIGARRAPPAKMLASPNNLSAWFRHWRNTVIWDGDGTESSVALVSDAAGYAFIVNGKSDGNVRGDAGTQVMLALIGAIKHPDPRSAMVIGLGTGSTAGWLGAVPSIDRVDVVELEPIVLDVARACELVNQNVMNNPKVSIEIGDAREALLTGRSRYDVIASEPSNPYRAGIASLFTLEFYQAAANRLTDDGVFAQWVQAYDIDMRTLATIYATMAAVFGEIETWQTTRGDLLLLATRRPQRYNIDDLEKRIAAEPYKSALLYAWRAVDLNGLLAHYVANDAVARALAASAGAAVNTDDRNLVEFGLAKAIGHQSAVIATLRRSAQDAAAAQPVVEGGASIDWAKVDTAWVSYMAAERSLSERSRMASTRGEQARQNALRQYYAEGNAVGAGDSWDSQSEPPRDPSELAMLADIKARVPDEQAAIPLIDQLRRYQPAEADIVLATLRFGQGKLDETTDALSAAFVRLRTDPWPLLRFQQSALGLARTVGTRSTRAKTLFDALAEPFANQMMDRMRLFIRAELSMNLPEKQACIRPVSAFGDYVPWDERFLRLRRDCFSANGDSRLAAANAELREFLAHEAPVVPLESASSSR